MRLLCLPPQVPKESLSHNNTGKISSHFLRSLFLLILTILRPDLSLPPVPSEKLPPPALKARLPEAWNGGGLCGVERFCWAPNWNGLAPAAAFEPDVKPAGSAMGCC